MKYTVHMAGVGGQGVLLAAAVLSSAAVADGLDVAMSEVHGMAQRGGSVTCTVRMGRGVLSPLSPAGGADLLLGFEPAEACRSLGAAGAGAAVITSTAPIEPVSVSMGRETYPPLEEILSALQAASPRVLAFDAAAEAAKAGNAIAANAVLIGAMSAADGFPLPKARMLEALLEMAPKKAREINERAFQAGYELGSGRI